MREVLLYGRLRKRFGHRHELDVASVSEAVRALCSLFKGFRAALSEGAYRIVKGDLRGGLRLGPEELTLPMGPQKAIHLVPVPSGAGGGGGGTGKTIIGAVIVIAAVAGALYTGGGSLALGAEVIAGMGVTYGGVAAFGAAMLFAGVSQMLTPVPKAPSAQDAVDTNPSFLFNGPQNTAAQGMPVPLVYGRMRVGSIVAASSLIAEKLVPSQFDPAGKVGCIATDNRF